MHSKESTTVCVGSLGCYVIILESSYVVLTFLYKRFGLALKSPRTAIKKGLFAAIESRLAS